MSALKTTLRIGCILIIGVLNTAAGADSGSGIQQVAASTRPNRKVPPQIAASLWAAAELPRLAVPLPQADCQSEITFRQRRFGRVLRANGTVSYFQPEVVLLKFREQKHVSALRVEPDRELEAVHALTTRRDVQFAELNTLQERQFQPNDAQLSNQWHHTRIRSYEAWDHGLGTHLIRIAIVDSPFQMDHPDLAANVGAGWSIVSNTVVTASAGIPHSTLGAGLAAAVVNNGLGLAGAGNCQVLPIDVTGFTEEMYAAIIWAADHNVRVVNISWTGADSPTLNEAGAYLKEHCRGLLAMAGGNGRGSLDYPNHPYIYSISSTDQADNLQSCWGDHIDFSAPGYGVVSTTINGSYATVSGTSYSTPLFCGVVGVLLSINPTLSPDEVIDILQQTAADKGPSGWDPYFGWGRIDFGKAAAAAHATLPRISNLLRSKDRVIISSTYRPGLDYSLWSASSLDHPTWLLSTNAGLTISNGVISFTIPAPVDGTAAFYRVSSTNP